SYPCRGYLPRRKGPLGGAPRGTQRRREEAMNRFTRIAPAWPRAALALTLALTATCAHAQTSIRLLVGSPAGGAIDIYARTISDHMSRSLGLPVLVDNKPGAHGNIAAQATLDGPADGSLIWTGPQPMLEVNPHAYRNLPRTV